MGEGGGSCLRDYAYHKMIAYRMVLVRFFLGGGSAQIWGQLPQHTFLRKCFWLDFIGGGKAQIWAKLSHDPEAT